MKNAEFAKAIVLLIEDEHAVGRASRRDLAVLEGVMTALVHSVTAELARRDRLNKKPPLTPLYSPLTEDAGATRIDR